MEIRRLGGSTKLTQDQDLSGYAQLSGATFTGSLALPYVTKTANYIATSSDHTIDCTANTFTVTLPTAVGITGRIYNIKNSGTGTITVDGDGTEAIDGEPILTINQYDCITVQSTNAGWIIV